MSTQYLATVIQRTKLHAAILATTLGTVLGAFTNTSHAQYDYTQLSSATTSLAFGSGGSQANAPLPSFAVGLGLNTAQSSSVSGGNSWNLTAGGSVLVGAVVVVQVNLYSTQANTNISGGALNFGTVSDGALAPVLSELAGLNTFFSHTARKSFNLTGTTADRFAYNFDLSVNNGLLSLDASLLSSLTISAWSGSTQIASASVFQDVLGLLDVTNSFYSNARFEFDFDPSSGPLEIRFSTNIPVNVDLLELLTGSTNTFYSISNTSFGELTPSPVPEPSSLILCAIGLSLILRRGYFKRSV